MSTLADQLARRDRLMRHMHLQLTPRERLARAEALRAFGMEQMRKNPQALDRFIRRNLRQRAIERLPDV